MLLCLLAVTIVAVAGVATAMSSSDDSNNNDGGYNEDSPGDNNNTPGDDNNDTSENDNNNTPEGDTNTSPDTSTMDVLVGDVIRFESEVVETYSSELRTSYTVVNINSEGKLDVEVNNGSYISGRQMTKEDYLDMMYLGSTGDYSTKKTIEFMGKSVECNVYISTGGSGKATYYYGVDDGVMYRMELQEPGYKNTMNLVEATPLNRDQTKISATVRTDLEIGDYFQFKFRSGDENRYLFTDYYSIDDINDDGTVQMNYNYNSITQKTQDEFMEFFAPGLRTDLTGENVNIWRDGVIECKKYVYSYSGYTITEYVGIDDGILYWLFMDGTEDIVYRFDESSLVS